MRSLFRTLLFVLLGAAVIGGAAYYFLYWKDARKVVVAAEKVHFPAAPFSIDRLSTPWELKEAAFSDDSGLVIYYEQPKTPGKMYFNLIERSPDLTLNTIKKRSFDKMQALGFKRTARNAADGTYFFVNQQGELTGFYFAALGSQHLFSSYVVNRIDLFAASRTEWLEVIKTVVPTPDVIQ